MALVRPRIVYPSGSSSSFTFVYPPRIVPFRIYDSARHDLISSAGVRETIFERTDEFFEFDMEYVKLGTDVQAWNGFVQTALQGLPFDYYPDSTLPGWITYLLEDTNWTASYKQLAMYNFHMRWRKRRLCGSEPPLIACAIPHASVGSPFSFILTATLGTAPYSWSIEGDLPRGITLNHSTGELSGTPTTVGTSSFVITVYDSVGYTSSKICSMMVVAPVACSSVIADWTDLNCTSTGWDQIEAPSNGNIEAGQQSSIYTGTAVYIRPTLLFTTDGFVGAIALGAYSGELTNQKASMRLVSIDLNGANPLGDFSVGAPGPAVRMNRVTPSFGYRATCYVAAIKRNYTYASGPIYTFASDQILLYKFSSGGGTEVLGSWISGTSLDGKVITLYALCKNPTYLRVVVDGTLRISATQSASVDFETGRPGFYQPQELTTVLPIQTLDSFVGCSLQQI